MESPKSKTKIPLWVWLFAGAVVLMLCAMVTTGALAIGALSIFTTTAPESSAAVVLADPIENTELTEETPSSSEEPALADDLPPTNTPVGESGDQEPVEEPTISESQIGEPTPDSGSDPSETGTEVVDTSAAVRATIEANVVDIRDLEPLESVHPTHLTVSGLSLRLEEEFADSYSPDEARNDAIALSAFDFLEPDFDLYNFTIGLLAEQIAGFYDPETDEFVIVSDDDDFDVLEQWTHAHEYVHALQDQYYDLEQLDDESLNSEASFAMQALAEGDATLVQTLYLLSGYFDQDQLFEIMTEALAIDTTLLDNAPPVLAHELEFPYLVGMEFVQTLYEDGGFPAVDAAWEHPPQTTEHILHPDRYLSGDAPQLVTLEPLTGTLGAGWQLVDEDILGEFYLREYLSQQLSDSQVDATAGGWGGDRYAVYWNESDQALVMLLKIVWDTPADLQEFHTIYPGYPKSLLGVSGINDNDGGTCWQGDMVICLYEMADQSLLLRAPDMAIMAEVAGAQIR